MDHDLNQGGKDPTLPEVVPDSENGKMLAKRIQERLQGYLGPDYTDMSLAKYIVVMLSHKTAKPVLQNGLVEFLGDADAVNFADWLFAELHDLLGPNTAFDQSTAPSRHIRSVARPRSRSRSPARNRDPRRDMNYQNRDIRPWERPSHMDMEERHHRDDEAQRDRYGRGSRRDDWFSSAAGGGDGIVKFDESSIARSEGAQYRDSLEPSFMGDGDPRNFVVKVPAEDPRVLPYYGNVGGAGPSGWEVHAGNSESERRMNRKRLKKARRRERRRQERQQQQVVVTVNGRAVESLEHAHAVDPNNAFGAASATLPGVQNGVNIDPLAPPAPECSVLVKGLPIHATTQIIRAHFRAVCGPVPRVSILRRPVTAEQSDLAWVHLSSEAAAARALMLSGSTLLLEQITVWPKDSDEAREAVDAMNQESLEAAFPPDPFAAMMYGGGYEDWEEAEPENNRNRFKYVRQAPAGEQQQQQNGQGASHMETETGANGADVRVKEES